MTKASNKIAPELSPDALADLAADAAEQTAPPVVEEEVASVETLQSTHRPANHFGEWPVRKGQRVMSEAFDGIGTVMAITGDTATVAYNGELYFVAIAQCGVVAGDA